MTLQINNIIPENQQLMIPSIRTNHCVTDKADGLRAFLLVADNGRLYLIDMNINVMFTGSITKYGKFKNSILDGENVKHQKDRGLMNLFSSFDIYYSHGKYVGGLNFKTLQIEGVEKKTCRHDLLELFLGDLKTEKITNVTEGCELSIKGTCKYFASTDNKSIFQASKEIELIISNNYEKDGLIFTPSNTGVDNSKEPFKWKPPQQNAIDFLVKIKKVKGQEDEIRYVYVDGNNLQDSGNGISKDKTLELMCGFSENDGFLRPMCTLLKDEPTPPTKEYKPVNFYPTNPVNKSACFCNVLSVDNVIRTEKDAEIIEDDTIVEFRYEKEKKDNPTDDNAWKWVPIRNRHDKTAELRNAM